MDQEFASALLENAVNEFSRLPGIGRKTALRLVLHLLRQKESVAVSFGESIIKLRKEIRYCSVCNKFLRMKYARYALIRRAMKELFAW